MDFDRRSRNRTQSNSPKHLGGNRAHSIERSVIEPLHTTPKEYEKAALFLRSVKPSVHTDSSRERSFSKTLLKPEEFPRKPALHFSVDGNYFEHEAF